MSFPIGETAAVTAAILWAFTSIVFTEAGRLTTPMAANTFKTIFATGLLAGVLWLEHGVPWGPDIARADVAVLGLSGICGLTIGDSFLFLGFQAIGPRRANLVFALAPVFGAVGAYLFLDERLSAISLVGMAAALGGVAWVVSERRRGRPIRLRMRVSRAYHDQGHPLEGRVAIGVVVVILAALGQASGALLAKPVLERVGNVEATQIRVAAGALGLLTIGTLGRRLATWTRLIVRGRLYLPMAVASFLGPFIGIWLMTVSLDHAKAGIAITLLSTTPVWMLPLGAWLQRDHPTVREVIGMVVALAGIAVLFLK